MVMAGTVVAMADSAPLHCYLRRAATKQHSKGSSCRYFPRPSVRSFGPPRQALRENLAPTHLRRSSLPGPFMLRSSRRRSDWALSRTLHSPSTAKRTHHNQPAMTTEWRQVILVARDVYTCCARRALTSCAAAVIIETERTFPIPD